MKTSKICSVCKIEKDLDLFFKNKLMSDGHVNQCKSCIKIKRKIYVNENKERLYKKHKEYVIKNKEKVSNRKKIYEEKNKKEIAITKKIYAIKNKEHISKYQKEYYAKNKEKIKEYSKEKTKEYRKTKEGKIKYQTICRNRRAKIKSSGIITQEESREILKKYKGVCYWCNNKIKGTPNFDHYEPISKGGEHIIQNIVISCPSCNFKKSAKDPIKFANSLGRLL